MNLQAISKVLEIAENEIGYLEKASNSQLDDKIANAGRNNWTKFARDLDQTNIYNGKKNGYAWCDVFVDWCMMRAFGLELAQKITNQPSGGYGAGCTFSAKYYQYINRFYREEPKAGDQIFFTKDAGESMYHTGLVVKVVDGRVYTIVGNTSSQPGVEPNGGAVNAKSYPLGAIYIGGYGRPDYDLVPVEGRSDPSTQGEVFYHKLGDVPKAYRPAIEQLMREGALKGRSDVDPDTLEDNVLDISETFCRVFTVLKNLEE